MVCWYRCICHGHLMAHLTACCLITVQLSAPIGWNEECWLETLRNWSWGTNYETFFLVCSSVTSTWQRPKFKMSECPLKYIFQSARWGGCRMMRNHNHSQYSVFQAFTGCHLFHCAHIQLHHSSRRKLNSRQSIIPALKWNLIKLVIRLRCFLPSVCQMFLMHHHHLSATPRNFFFLCQNIVGAGHRVAVLCWELIDELLMKGLLKASVLIHRGPDDSIIATGTQLKKTCTAKRLKSEDGIIILYTAPLVSLLYFYFFILVSVCVHSSLSVLLISHLNANDSSNIKWITLR